MDGVISVIFGFTGWERIRWWMVLWGAVAVGAGLFVFLWPGITALVLMSVVAAWAVLTGASEIAAAVMWRQAMHNEWWLIVAGILSVVVGGVLAIAPGADAVSLVWLIGAYAVVVGVLWVMIGFRLRQPCLRRRWTMLPQGLRGRATRWGRASINGRRR